jgi:methylphosphotriester-DNA--protein-cysteine methyltransferase
MHRDLGIGPKFGARVARLSATVKRASAGATSWSAVAADAGFYDQSHLVGEFQALIGTTPTQWLSEERRNLQGWRHLAD